MNKSYHIFIKAIVLLWISTLFTFSKTYSQGGTTSNPQVLPGFTDDKVSDGWEDLRQLVFDSLGRMFVVEGAGEIWIVDTNGVKITSPLLNIKEEVGQWSSHGLTGLALDKNFLTNGYFYVMYTVDRHHLIEFGTPNYNANVNNYFSATINRVTRFQADPTTNFTTLIPNSRFVLIGHTKQTGIPVTYTFHDGGHLEMVADGSLIISTGDNAHGGSVDTGSNAQTYYAQCLADSILIPQTNIGGFRSQLLQSLNGKLLRIDPMTGLGIQSNPFYDAAQPNATISKVWCLGLRQPYQFSVRPGTSSTDITAGNPGTFYIGDVGFYKWESLFVSDLGAENFGWPSYEGMTPHNGFISKWVPNYYAPNPLYNTGGCTQPYFYFKDLLHEPTLDPNAKWPNPCDTNIQTPNSVPRFIRKRPTIAFYHADSTTYVPTWNGYNPTLANVGAPGSPTSGLELKSQCISGVEFYLGDKFPSNYKGQLFVAEYDTGYICNIILDSANNALSVDTFATGLGDCMAVTYNHKDQALYYIEYPYEIHRIRYTLGINVAPTARIIQDKRYGPSPTSVSFNGNTSSDPEGAALFYQWSFGDGNTATGAQVSHIYTAPNANPIKYDVVLTVTDSGNLTHSTSTIVSINNTPPNVAITSPINGNWYSALVAETINLTANVSDVEHSQNQLHYAWYVSLHHNTHEHPNPIDTDKVSYFVSSPEDSLETYSYEVTLTVTDDAGLSNKNTVFIYQGNTPIADFVVDKTTICLFDSVHFTSTIIGKADSLKWTFQNGTPPTSNAPNPTVTYKTAFGVQDVKLIVYNPYGKDTVNYLDIIKVKAAPNPQQNISGTLFTCVDDSVLLFTNYDTNYAYQWHKNLQPIIGATDTSYMATNTGTYQVFASQPNGCSTSTLPLYFAEHMISTQLTSSGSLLLCNQDSVVLMADQNPDYTYQWFLNNIPIINSNSYAYTATKTGSYKAFITDLGQCFDTTQSMSVIKMPESEAQYVSDSILCPTGDTVMLLANNGVALTYQWFNFDIPINFATSISYAALQPGLYSVMVSDAAGCAHMSNYLPVTGCAAINNFDVLIKALYPNPTKDNINIVLKKPTVGTAWYKVVDMWGREVISETNLVKGTSAFNVKTNFASGLYQLIIWNEEIGVMQFVKN
jgi:PKD repeat protein/glucose/arabinose dehydrogenase